MGKEHFTELMNRIKTYQEKRDNRTIWYEDTRNRFDAFDLEENDNRYYERRIVNKEYYDSIEEVKDQLKIMQIKTRRYPNLTIEFSSIRYDFLKRFDRIRESRIVKKLICRFNLRYLLDEWLIAISMGARYRLLERKYGNNDWYKKHIGKEYSDRSKACDYKNSFKKLYLAQRKKVFKQLRAYARKNKLNYKLIPLDPTELFIINSTNMI